MLRASQLESWSVRVILAVLLILEVACIAYTYSVRFDDYIAIVAIGLSILIAYFGTHYLINKFRTVKTYQAVAEATDLKSTEDETKKEVKKLLDTPQFKEFQRKKAERSLRQAEEGEEEKENSEVEGVIQELLEMEEKIFAL